MSEQAQAMEKHSKEMDRLGREMEERCTQIEGRMRLQDQRFGQVLVGVESSLSDWKPEMEEVKARLDRLEKKIDPAA